MYASAISWWTAESRSWWRHTCCSAWGDGGIDLDVHVDGDKDVVLDKNENVYVHNKEGDDSNKTVNGGLEVDANDSDNLVHANINLQSTISSRNPTLHVSCRIL